MNFQWIFLTKKNIIIYFFQQEDEEPRSRTPETRRILVLNSPPPSTASAAPPKLPTERNWIIPPSIGCSLWIDRLVCENLVCWNSSDWRFVEASTARFRRPIEAGHVIIRLVRIKKKRQGETETYPTGHSDRDRSRYMLENVLIILSQSYTSQVFCVQRNARCIHVYLRTKLFFFFPYLNFVLFF